MVAAGALVSAALVTAGLAAYDTWKATRGLHQTRAIVRDLSLDHVAQPDRLVASLGRASRAATSASHRLDSSPWVAIWQKVPVVGTQLDAVGGLAAVTAEGAGIAHDTAHSLNEALSSVDPDGRMAALRDIETRLAELREELSSMRLPSSRLLVPPVSGARDALQGELRSADRALQSAGRGIDALIRLLGGPTDVLVLAANNAEMRSGGMVLSVGDLAIRDGGLGPVTFRPTERLAPSSPVSVPPGVDDLYGWLEPGREWRNTGTSPNFPAMAPVYRRLARASGLGDPDTVVQADVVALRRLLEVLGPVTVRDIGVPARRVEKALLNTIYLRVPGRPDVRRRLEHEVASAVFAAMDERSWDLGKMVRALAISVRERHLMAWSANPEVQEGFRAVGAAGALDPDGLLVAVQNHAGGKLDWYVEVEMTVQEAPLPDGRTRAIVSVEVANDAPAGLPSSVAGTGAGGVPPGDYRAFVTAYLPRSAQDVFVSEPALVSGVDGTMPVFGVRVDVPGGSTWKGTFAFTLPADHAPVRLMPSGRASPVPVHTPGGATTDTARPVVVR